MKKLLTLTSVSMLLLFGSCEHKELCFDEEHQGELTVVFDWRNAPDANPESMVTYFYDATTGQPLRFIFPGKTGGLLRIPYSTYHALSMNGDDNDWVKIRYTADIDNFETYTPDAENLSSSNLSTRAIPRAEGTADERMAQTPGMLYSDRRNNLDIHFTTADKTITFFPEEAVCHYTVDVTDVENIQNLDRAEIDGTISGMAEGYNHGAHAATDNHVTMPFTLTANTAAADLHAEFLTFGECPSTAVKHILTIYLYLKDGTRWYYTFDVTSQISTAPDPKHVHIVVSGLHLPKPIQGDGGFVPNVNDWQTENIDLKM